MDVQTDHQIVNFGEEMILFSAEDSTVHARATRASGVWTITADSVPDVTANSRGDAITALTNQALLSLRGTLDGPGFSTICPHGLTELP